MLNSQSLHPEISCQGAQNGRTISTGICRLIIILYCLLKINQGHIIPYSEMETQPTSQCASITTWDQWTLRFYGTRSQPVTVTTQKFAAIMEEHLWHFDQYLNLLEIKGQHLRDNTLLRKSTAFQLVVIKIIGRLIITAIIIFWNKKYLRPATIV